MSIVEVKIPQVGESITEGVLVEWAVADGGITTIDEPLLVLETDKVTMTVAAEVSGRLKSLVEADTVVEVGQVVATIDTSAFWYTELLSAEGTYFLFVEAGRGGETEVYLATHEGPIATEG